jgi:hypothetical protein
MKRDTAPAPSTLAASYSSGGIVWSLARIEMSTNGKKVQILTATRVQKIQSGPSQIGA